MSGVELIKADLMKGPSGLTAPSDAPATASPTSLIDKLLASFLKDVKEAYETPSKVIDENDEPLVVYNETATEKDYDKFSKRAVTPNFTSPRFTDFHLLFPIFTLGNFINAI